MAYSIIVKNSENIVGFFEDQPGGKLCLALILDLCHEFINNGKEDALECTVETLCTICNISKEWVGITEDWGKIFLEIIEMEIDK